MSLSDAEALVPQVHLSHLLRSLVPAGVSTERVIVQHPEYMTDLHQILNKTSKKTLQAYLQWKAIQSFAGHIEADAVKPLQEFNKILGGQVCRHSVKPDL